MSPQGRRHGSSAAVTSFYRVKRLYLFETWSACFLPDNTFTILHPFGAARFHGTMTNPDAATYRSFCRFSTLQDLSPASSNERQPLQKLRAKLRRLRDRNKRLQGLLLQRHCMKTTAELVESLREYLPPAVAAFVEAQLKMRNGSWFGRRWCSQNKTFALGLYFHSPKG